MSATYDYKKMIVDSDCDPSLTLSIGGALELMSDCEHLQIASDEFIDDYFKKNNYAWFLSARSIEVVKMPKFLDEVLVKTALYEINTITGNRSTFIYDKSGNVLVKSNSFGVLVDLKTGKAIRRDAFLNYKLADNLGFNALPRKVEYETQAAVKVDSVVMPSYFLDHYNHVNNANYVRLASEYIDWNFAKGILRAEYKSAAASGDLVEIFKHEQKDRVIIDLRNVDGGSYCIIEFKK
ncbi:MAG: thioesterase [Firmicutes bacterium]|nr:thioesterase [Bacillota bacterium]